MFIKHFTIKFLKCSTFPFFLVSPEMFYLSIFPGISCALTVHSLCILAVSVPLHLHSPFTKHSLCIHKVLITLRSPFVQHPLIVLSDNIIFRLITIHTCSLFGFFYWLPMKHNVKDYNSQGTLNIKSYILPSYIAHHAFTVHLALTFGSAFAYRSPFIGAHKYRSERAHQLLLFAHLSLTVQVGK